MPDMSLSREKTTLRVARDGGEPQDSVIGSNRMSVTLRRVGLEGHTNEQYLVIRGRNLPSTIRLAAILLQCFGTLGSIVDPTSKARWQRDWREGLSPHEANNPQENWIAVYRNGDVLFDSEAPEALHRIEEIARGNEIDHAMMKHVGDKLSRPGVDVEFENDSQLAFILNETKRGVKVAILDRTLGREGSYHFTLGWNQARKDRMRDIVTALHAATTIVDASATVSMLGRMKRQLGTKTGAESDRLGHDFDRGMQRVRELQSRLDVIANTNALDIAPRRPNFLADLQAD